ncbi:MAG: UDP-N-acetylmuramate--L-alanine ligase [Tepidiforma sp.]|nr:MAG: UDP-N-acetylmuramate--L-alanine ligase [Tepidiforma sp.]
MTGTLRGPIHLVGIGGIHMSAIARLLLQRGIAVSGSDLRRSPLTDDLEARGARIFEGHAAEHLPPGTALVVTTAAARTDNPEIAEAGRRGIPVILRAEMVARLLEGKRLIAVAGSHGKTTTSSLIAFILDRAGRQPMYLLGGECPDLGGHAAWGAGDLAVVEADEYRRAFHAYTPAVAVITTVEPDHLDDYGTPEAYAEAFHVFARRTQPGGLLLACTDDAGARRVLDLLAGEPFEREAYGLDAAAHWRAVDVRLGPSGGRFTLERAGRPLGDIDVRVPGLHFVRNAAAAAAVALHLDVPFEAVRTAIAEFHGARRRFEYVGEAAGITVIDDYAHHPTEVRALVETARAAFPGRRLIGIHQPHTYSRIAYLWNDWLGCFSGLDDLLIVETYAAREDPAAGRSARDLAAAITAPHARYAADFDEAVRIARGIARPGDVVLTIGAGDVNEVGPRLLEALR